MTKNQREFQREMQRLERSISRLTKKHQFVQTQSLPEQPKRITKRMIKQLKQLKGKTFVTEIDIDTGEVIREALPVSIYKRKPKRMEYKPVFSVYLEILARFQQARQEVLAQYGQSAYEHDLIGTRVKLIDDLIAILESKHDEYEEQGMYGMYTAYLKKHEEEIAECLTPIIYSSDQAEVEYNYSELVRILAQNDLMILGVEIPEEISQLMEDMPEGGNL